MNAPDQRGGSEPAAASGVRTIPIGRPPTSAFRRRAGGLPAQVQPDADHRAARIDERDAPPEVRGEHVVGGQSFLGVIVERIEHVEEQLRPVRGQGSGWSGRGGDRAGSATTSRREPRGSSRMRTSPCGSATGVVAAHGLPVKCCRFAETTMPLRGMSTLPITRNMCGRSFGSRPRALVRSFGSRPKTSAPGGATVLTCGASGVAAARCLQPIRPRQRVRAERLPPVRSAPLDDRDQAVVGQRVVVLIGQPEAAGGRSADEKLHRHGRAVRERLRSVDIPPGHVGPSDEVARRPFGRRRRRRRAAVQSHDRRQLNTRRYAAPACRDRARGCLSGAPPTPAACSRRSRRRTPGSSPAWRRDGTAPAPRSARLG